MHRYLRAFFNDIDDLCDFRLKASVKSAHLCYSCTYEVDPWVNALSIQIECKSDKIRIACSFSISE